LPYTEIKMDVNYLQTEILLNSMQWFGDSIKLARFDLSLQNHNINPNHWKNLLENNSGQKGYASIIYFKSCWKYLVNFLTLVWEVRGF